MKAMLFQTLSALVVILPIACAFYIGTDYDAPDQKFLKRNAYGQLQAFDVSHERKFVHNAYGGISPITVTEFSDPDIYRGNAILPPISLPVVPHVHLPPPFAVPFHPRYPIIHHYCKYCKE